MLDRLHEQKYTYKVSVFLHELLYYNKNFVSTILLYIILPYNIRTTTFFYIYKLLEIYYIRS